MPANTPPPQTSSVNGERRLAAIMFTDIVGFSRQMGSDEARMLRVLEVHNQHIQHTVTDHRRSVMKIMGDAFLVDFLSVVHAVQYAQQFKPSYLSKAGLKSMRNAE